MITWLFIVEWSSLASLIKTKHKQSGFWSAAQRAGRVENDGKGLEGKGELETRTRPSNRGKIVSYRNRSFSLANFVRRICIPNVYLSPGSTRYCNVLWSSFQLVTVRCIESNIVYSFPTIYFEDYLIHSMKKSDYFFSLSLSSFCASHRTMKFRSKVIFQNRETIATVILFSRLEYCHLWKWRHFLMILLPCIW